MRRIGLIGGLSWESSAEYYRIINQAAQRRLGGLHSANCVMLSFDFAEIEALQAAGDWAAATQRMALAARRVAEAGARWMVTWTNTIHEMADAVQAAAELPLVHIADATAQPILQAGLQTVGLLGTRFTMQQHFYRGRLGERHGLNVLIPDEASCAAVHDIIYNELVRGEVRAESRREYQRVIEQLAAAGAQAVILGCTEISLLIKPADSALPTYDSTELHALAALDWALA
ncbi:MAG: aspartate/glutamate racemase family protein [Chloroflexi bacterium]|nr:aspartate/glutamate racemase family protein [Chloroflexota bacterium]